MPLETVINNENNHQDFLEKRKPEVENSFKRTPLKDLNELSSHKQHPPLPLSLQATNSNADFANNVSSSYTNTKPSDMQSPDSQRLSFIQQQHLSQQQQGSPLNHSNLFNNSINTSHNMNISPQIERSMRLTTELESLVNDLDLIYNEIGLSTKEIQQKEADIFRNLSDTIRSFSVKAQQEKQNISKENSQILDCLKTILYKIGDSKGTYTINDLYIRNMIILSQHDLSPSKRDMSLLSKRRILMQGAEYVFEVFDKILREYLRDCLDYVDLKRVTNQEGNQNNEEYEKLGLLLPEECLQLKELLKDSNKLSKCFFDNILNKDSFPYKILNYTDLQNYNTSFYNKLALNEKKENKLKKLIKEMHSDYLNKKEVLITELRKISETCAFLQLRIPEDISRFANSSFEKYEQLLTNSLLAIPSLTDKIPIYDDFIGLVSGLLNSITQAKLQRLQLNEDLFNQVTNLWSKLKVDHFETVSFESKLNRDFDREDCTLPVSQIKMLQDELSRLKMLRKSSIKQIIKEDWDRINELWDTMRFSQAEREDFKTIYETKQREIKAMEDSGNNSGNLYDENEVLLNKCEDEIKLLDEKFKLFEPLLKNIALYESFLNDKLELAESSKNPGRLTSRDSHKILLREEKIRKKISRYFPSVVNNLALQLQEFSDNFNRPFINDNGENYLDIILKEKETLMLKYPRSRVVMNQQGVKASSNQQKSAISENKSQLIHRAPSAGVSKGLRERNKKILNTAAKPQENKASSKLKPLSLASTTLNSTKPHLSSSSAGSKDYRSLVSRSEPYSQSRISSRNSISSSLTSRAASRTISNRSETSIKAESPNPNLLGANVDQEFPPSDLKSHNRITSPRRMFKRYERNTSILKRQLSPDKIAPEEYTFKKVRISNNDQVINRSLSKSISYTSASLSPIKPKSFIAGETKPLHDSSPMRLIPLKSNIHKLSADTSSHNSSLNDDVDVAEDMKFNLWQREQLAKIGTNIDSHVTEAKNGDNIGFHVTDAKIGGNIGSHEPEVQESIKKDAPDSSEVGICINDTSNF